MKCNKCPLYSYWNNENDRGEDCKLFGDSWDSPFLQYTDEGAVIGCYIEKAFIDKVDKQIELSYLLYVDYLQNQICKGINYGTAQSQNQTS